MEMDNDEFVQRKIRANLIQAEGIFKQHGVKFITKLLDDREYPDHLGKDTIKYADEVNADLIMIMTHAENAKNNKIQNGNCNMSKKQLPDQRAAEGHLWVYDAAKKIPHPDI